MAKGKLALGALIGAAAGFVSGILLAPKSGKETRAEIKKDALKVKDTAVKEAEELKDKATKVANDVSDKVKEVSEDVTAKAKEVKGHFDKAVEGSKDTLSDKPNTTKKK
jgi:gas vesicle protein